MDPKKLIFFCIICVFKNAYYNVGFDVFYLKKSFMWFCWRIMDEIRKKKRGSRIRVPVLLPDTKERRSVKIIKIYIMFSYVLFHEHFILNVFYLKKSFMWFCWRVMDEIRKIGKLLKKNSKWRKEMNYI
jgi:hypothetical protein